MSDCGKRTEAKNVRSEENARFLSRGHILCARGELSREQATRERVRKLSATTSRKATLRRIVK